MRETDSGNTGYSFWHPDLEVSSRRQVYVRIMIAYVIMCTIGCRSTYNRTKEDDTNLPIRKVGGADWLEKTLYTNLDNHSSALKVSALTTHTLTRLHTLKWRAWNHKLKFRM